MKYSDGFPLAHKATENTPIQACSRARGKALGPSVKVTPKVVDPGKPETQPVKPQVILTSFP